MIENKALSDKSQKSKINELNEKTKDAEKKAFEANEKLLEGEEKYSMKTQNAYAAGNNIYGVMYGLSAARQRKMNEYLKQDYEEASKYVDQVKKEVNNYIANYANKNIKDFKSN